MTTAHQATADSRSLVSEMSTFDHVSVGATGSIVHADCLDWLRSVPTESIAGVVTDPPYGVKEYRDDQLAKLKNGNRGGVWRIPPSFDGSIRSPLPRFTALTTRERAELTDFFELWSKELLRVLKPGAHVFMASNSFLSQLVFSAVAAGGLEFRGEFIRLVRTLRGGDRPKGAEQEFSDVTTMPRGCYEPWGIFRKPLPIGMRVSDCLRIHGTGGLRRLPDGGPFCDVVQSERTPRAEKQIAPHPSLKPQSLLRLLVRTAIPTSDGILLDPFSGSGSTVAAAVAQGITAVGVERDRNYFDLSTQAAPLLALVTSKGFPRDASSEDVLFV